jgi:phosphoglycerate dehydrogenase-like enzyme
MALAAAKRLLVEHQNLSRGQFNQFTPNRVLAGKVCGCFGFGGYGVATARLMRCLGMRIHAINRRGAADEPVDWIGPSDRLHALMAASDVLVISAPLNRATQGVIGERVSLMKDDAILINLARGEIIDEAALYEHLKAKPQFTACIDAWWIEPVRHGEFRRNGFRPSAILPLAWVSECLVCSQSSCPHAPLQQILSGDPLRSGQEFDREISKEQKMRTGPPFGPTALRG